MQKQTIITAQNGLKRTTKRIPETQSSNISKLKPTLKRPNIDVNNLIDTSEVNSLTKYTTMELFAGCGGLALGLEEAGFETIALNEINKHACATLRRNRPEWHVIEEDIITFVKNGINKYIKNMPQIDLLSGGYPCQAFSYAGRRLGLEDTRGTMFYSYAELLKQIKPKMFLVENVKGLLTHDNGATLKTMIDIFEDIGYHVVYQTLNAKNYGVAQKRERLAIIGVRKEYYRKGITPCFPKPYENLVTLGEVIKDVPISEGAKYPDKKRKILDLVPPGGYWRDLPEKIAKEYMGVSYYSGGGRTGMARRLSWDEQSLTLTCSPAQKQTERCHPSETRPFTVREYARIQSFPDAWEFEGSMNEKYKQIGNAVPVKFATAIGLAIVHTLNQIYELGL